MVIENIRFLIYTNENNQGLAELCLKYLLKCIPQNNVKVSVLSNRYNNQYFQFSDRATYLSSNIDLKLPNRFVETIKYGLSNIEEEYVFLILDDYIFRKEVRYENLEKLIKIMICDNIDFLSFDTLYLTTWDFLSWEKFKSNCDNSFDDYLIYRPSNFKFLYSVQPCIWKKSSLLNLFETCGNFSLHDLDMTTDIIKEKTKHYKNLAINKINCFDFGDIKDIDNYFLIAYSEVVRHGVFLIPENGYPSDVLYEHSKFIYQLIKDEDLESKPEFNVLLNWYKFRDKSIKITDTTTGYELWEPVKRHLHK